MNSRGALPPRQGLYDPANEHDACGVGFVANIKGKPSHDIVQKGLTILQRLEHRGAVGADPKAGDGAGILFQMPHSFFKTVVDFTLPEKGKYAVGMVFMAKDAKAIEKSQKLIDKLIVQEGQHVLGWRDVPVDNAELGYSVKPSEPAMKQVFVGCGSNCAGQDAFERKLFVIRKQIENTPSDFAFSGLEQLYFTSLSSRVINYKGMLMADQVATYFDDLADERMESSMALVHQRFSTNTFPTWELAHPYRMVAHNGEINTVRGNKNWMAARRHSMSSDLFGDDLEKIFPLIDDAQSDTACFDNTLELLTLSGYSISHAMMMLIPEAWSSNPMMDKDRRAFYEYHAAMMEPWDGPAAVVFTDGRQIGATLDRNGLRPARYLLTDDDLCVMASEMGTLDIPEHKIVKKWRLQPGKMFLIDLEQGRIIDDAEIKSDLAKAHPYRQWLNDTQLYVHELPPVVGAMAPDAQTLLSTQQAFGYTQEDIKFLLRPMLETGMEATGSMGTDVPPSVLSGKSKHLSTYFKQNFAQVTNPPIDPIREDVVMSLVSLIGPRPNLLEHEHAGKSMRLEALQPILTNSQLEAIRKIEDRSDDFMTQTIDICFPAEQGAKGMKPALGEICRRAESLVLKGNNILILSDRWVDVDHIAIPALLATAAVHHHLIRKGLRTQTGLVIETGSAIEIHHFATLAGYGAEAINPYLALDTIHFELDTLKGDIDFHTARARYIKAVGKGLKKVMSKMGISTYQSYCGAQIFDAIGLSTEFIDQYFTGTSTTIEGAGLPEIAEEAFRLHRQAHGNNPVYKHHLAVGGDYALRLRGERHVWTSESISSLQHAVRGNDAKSFAAFSKQINEQQEKLLNLRGLFRFNYAPKAVPLDEVESAKDIVKRFATGAMSFGSISHEAHSTLAIAMNAIGGKSNTGEGGEEARRFKPLADGSKNPERSAIKQIASGRFGVTTEYLVNADDLQIKMAQGAKPGEGGQLPGHKVNEQIANVRHSTQGVGLISPPPHHDIYSIEDLAQLIHDLKNVNPVARISVKLVSEVGVGTVAAGVSKAHADHVTISGYDGGTGASPLTSIKHAGSPWEIGLAETHQTLVLNNLRSRISVQVDGGLRTGRDVVIGALLGADEFGFATAPLIAEGCIMMRKCHLNTCPVGVATQDPELRKRFTGTPEHVINYFFFVAEEVRELMSRLGYRNMDEMIGQSQSLDARKAVNLWKAQGLDFTRLMTKPEAGEGVGIFHSVTQDHGLDKALDNELIKQAMPALESGIAVKIETTFHNYNRTIGAMLSGEVARRYGHQGLPDDTIHIKADGCAGQSFGAWLAKGVTIELAGEGNDYVGKGLSGGRIAIFPHESSVLEKAEENIIVGNTVLYGAIAGEAYFRGVAGERFCVRNSGATAVVEGMGDHGCEYMTGGVMVSLGETGRNFAAGMSGGIAYVYDPQGLFADRCNMEMIELESVQADGGVSLDQVLADKTQFDETRLKTIIENHKRYTNSAVAIRILENWSDEMAHFVKVMPVDFKRALTEQYAAREQASTAEVA
ncbi:MAG: glutamate synthase large subunit [Arenicellales bacterium]